ncbi:MAG: amino acid ABC transporter substrate-binding protein, partial [Sphingobacteriales bacterium]
MPFNATKTPSRAKADMERAAMAIDFYQGFKLGIDSAALLGRDFQLNVLDSRTGTATTPVLLKQTAVQQADLVVGPVFPENIRQLTAAGADKHFVSPLAASLTSDFNNQNLISLTPNIRLHADQIVAYIKKMPRLALINIVLINPKGGDGVFGERLRSKLAGDAKYIFQEFISIGELETKIQSGRHYVVLLASSEKG